MAIVYSYIRYSTKLQKKGSSERRQLERGDEWIKRHGHKLTKEYLDSGVSSLRGRNKHVGALSKFLEHIASGRVRAGEILLVEALDRLSRQGIDEAGQLFRQILKAGVKIAVLMPVERVYDSETLSNPAAMMETMWAFHLANLESVNKGKRVRDAWAIKRKTNNGRYNLRCPAWVTWNEKTQKFEPNDGAEAVRYIFKRTAEGIGQKALTKELNEIYEPIGLSKMWNGSYVQRVLSDRSVLGEYQPHNMTEDLKRVPAGKVLAGYYPAVVTEEDWLRAQGAKRARTKQKGPNTKFVNLWTGLLKNAHDGSPMHIQQVKSQRRLASWNHLRGVAGADPLSVEYFAFTTAVFSQLKGLHIEDMEDKEAVNRVREKEQQLAGIEARIEQITLAMARGEGDLSHLLAASKIAADDKKRVEEQLLLARAELSAAEPLRQLQELDEEEEQRELENETPDERRRRVRAFQLKLRGLVHELVREIVVKPEKHYGRVWCTCLIHLRTGVSRMVAFGPKLCWVHGNEVDPGFEDFGSRETLLDEVAKRYSQPGDDVKVEECPATLGEAATVFLKVRQSQMSKASFRVVPSKVRRFVNELGEDLPCKNITPERWGKFRRWVDAEVKAGRLAEGTGRVTWQRGREFVVWVQGLGGCPQFPV